MDSSQLPIQVVTRLAMGLIEQYEQTVQGDAPPITSLNPLLKTGLEQLCVICLSKGVMPPQHHKEVVEWLHQPVEEWSGAVGSLMAEAGLYDSLLFRGVPTDFAYDLKARLSEGEIEIEIQDLPFKEIIQYCRDKQLDEQYVSARLFLVEHSYLPTGTHVISQNLDWEQGLCEKLVACYERIPISARVVREGVESVALCPQCGWVMDWQTSPHTQVAQCFSDLCLKLNEQVRKKPRWVSYFPEAMRTTRGIQRSIVAPERSLLKLKSDLEELDRDIQCQLWPHFDSYDLLLKLPSGKRIAVDMKDYSDPAHLATVLKEFRQYPEWDSCYYIFPDYRSSGTYWKRFKAAWSRRCKVNPNLKSISVQFAGAFLKTIRKEVMGDK